MVENAPVGDNFRCYCFCVTNFAQVQDPWVFTRPKCEFDCLQRRFGLKEVSEGIPWAVREIIVQIRCDRKDAEWVKNVDEVAEKKSLSCGACVNKSAIIKRRGMGRKTFGSLKKCLNFVFKRRVDRKTYFARWTPAPRLNFLSSLPCVIHLISNIKI